MERRDRWWKVLPAALAVLAEAWLRDSLIIGVVTFSAILAVAGPLAEWPHPGILYGAAGLAGAALVLGASLRRWSVLGQWIVVVGVLTLEILLLALMTND